MKIIYYILLLAPSLIFAQSRARDPRRFSDIVDLILDLVNLLIPVVAGLALLVFFWGLVKFIYNAGDAKTHAEGRQFMLWGIIALFVMVSVWGILRLAYNEFGFRRSFGIPTLPVPPPTN